MDLLSLGYSGIFLLAFLINMLPFMSPSNLFIAASVSIALPWLNPILVGFLVAIAASFAKLTHYCLTFFIGKALKVSETRLEKYRRRARTVGPMLIFLAAVSPIPDDPIVISLGLVRYSPLKFFLFFFSGKMLITTLGASAGSSISFSLENILGAPLLASLSAILTVAMTYLLAKVDLEDFTRRVMDKIQGKI